ncbi:MAG: hypothetical protein KDA37_11080, partial [Planctomycetales bacterium]|nr:hypothetical protein [Planctomycetales bacterium]
MSDTPRSMAREDLFKLDWLQTAQLSPDASQIAYTVSHIEGKEGEEKEYSTIYLLDVATGTGR